MSPVCSPFSHLTESSTPKADHAKGAGSPPALLLTRADNEGGQPTEKLLNVAQRATTQHCKMFARPNRTKELSEGGGYTFPRWGLLEVTGTVLGLVGRRQFFEVSPYPGWLAG